MAAAHSNADSNNLNISQVIPSADSDFRLTPALSAFGLNQENNTNLEKITTLVEATISNNYSTLENPLAYYRNSSFEDYESFLSEYLEVVMGPKTLSMTMLIPITVVYVLIFVSGVVGNLSTCLVIFKSVNLQTATNYYLFSLAIADMVSLVVGLPNDLTAYWRQYPYFFGPVVCSLRALISEMTNNASVLTIVAFTVERYLAICHPLAKQKMSRLSRVVKIISVVWAVAFASALPFAALTRITYLDYPGLPGRKIEASAFCSMSLEQHHNLALLFSSLVFFVLPMCFITVLYVMIGLKLRNSKMNRLSKDSYTNNGNKPCPKKVLKILVSVVLAFVICWAPFHAQRLMFVFLDPDDWRDVTLRNINEKLFYVTGCFYYFNCTINPILYNLISDKYRKAYKETLCCCFYSSTMDRNGTTSATKHHHHGNLLNGFARDSPKTLDRISKSKVSVDGVFAPSVAYEMPRMIKEELTVCNGTIAKELREVKILY